jgi:hypothetical protein
MQFHNWHGAIRLNAFRWEAISREPSRKIEFNAGDSSAFNLVAWQLGRGGSKHRNWCVLLGWSQIASILLTRHKGRNAGGKPIEPGFQKEMPDCRDDRGSPAFLLG